MKRTSACIALLLCGCAVGPDYRRPDLPVPDAYLRAPPQASPRSLADAGWWEIFGDARLTALIDEALRDNLDLGIAASQILQAQGQLSVARSPIFPQVSAQLQATHGNENTSFTNVSSFLATLGLTWEIDFWGRYRRATEAARAALLATEEGQRNVAVSLVAGVAQQYLQLNALRQRVEIVQRTAAAQRDTLRLVRELAEHGVQSAAEVRQAESQLLTTENQIPGLERQIATTEDALALLLGKPPRTFAVPAELPANALPPSAPPGLPSQLIDRRPDIRQAEQQLIAANANVGVAKARFFPAISLTGAFGRASNLLRGLVESGAQNVHTASLGVDVPIFTGGALTGNYEAARAQAEQAALAYRRTVLVALQEVSDALVSLDRNRAEVEGNRERARVSAESLRLAELRFRSGVISFLEVLDAQRQLFSAQLDLNASELNQRLSAVQLYRALGGGWKQREANQQAEGAGPMPIAQQDEKFKTLS